MKATQDNTPRYTPNSVMTLKGRSPVIKAEFIPHADGCMVGPHVRLTTANGAVRPYGCERGWINSELRMVVQGFDARFEEMRAWKKAEVH